MRKYIVGLFIFIGCILMTVSGFSQSIFAGGEIFAKYVGNGSENCNQPLPYEITLRFCRDAPVGTIDPLPPLTDVFLVDITAKNPATWAFQTIQLDNLVEIPQLPNLCIKSNLIVTDCGIYSNSVPVLLDPNKRYKIIFGEQVPGGFSYIGREFHSPSNLNINGGQRFFLKTEVHTFCDTVRTFTGDSPANEEVVYHLGKNQGPIWTTKTEILETFCEGNSYSFDLKDYVNDNVGAEYIIRNTISKDIVSGPTILKDSLSYRIRPVLIGENKAAIYINPRNTYDPFPTAASDPFAFNEATGVMTFTPQLAPGELIYTAPLVVEVIEWRRVFTLEDDGNGTGNFIRRSSMDTASITPRQLRFIIAKSNLCDDNLPVVESKDWNATEQAWEFDCASDTLQFRFSKPMLFRSFSLEAPFDFRIFRGTNPKAPIDQSAYNPDAIFVHPDSINKFGEFSTFQLYFEDGLGPGRYSLFTRVGNDTNTVENLCGFFMPSFQNTEFIINTEYEYIFKDDDVPLTIGSQKIYCYPGDVPTFDLDALKSQKKNIVSKADLFKFSFHGVSPGAPAKIVDTTQFLNSRHNVYDTNKLTIPNPYEFPNTPLGNETQGFWRVGVGLNYPWFSFNGTKNDARCYDDDITFVSFATHPEVKTVDIDLCREDRWPVIKDLIDPIFTDPTQPGYIASGNPVSYFWMKYTDSVRTVVETNSKGEVVGFPGEIVIFDTIPVGGSSNSSTAANGNVNDTLDLELGVATGVGFESLQRIRVKVKFLNGCETTNYIQIVKQDVNVELSPEITEVKLGDGRRRKDTIICRDEAFMMFNTISDEYLRPEFMSRQWYFGENLANTMIQGDSTDTLSVSSMLQNGRGWYKLVVTKTTETSICTGADSVYINIADSLTNTDPECSIVTFDNNTKEVKQRFYWPTVEGADRYEVRGVDQEGNPLDSLGTSPTSDGKIQWFRANDTYGIHHWISGKEVKLYVRAVNNEVPVGTSCKYGPPVLSESCEIIVKPTNVFTPNGDGINDLLRFDLLELFNGNTLQVFNRWGKLVFESNDYQNDWDGGDLKEGTYFYVLDIDDPSGVQDIFKGTVTILR